MLRLTLEAFTWARQMPTNPTPEPTYLSRQTHIKHSEAKQIGKFWEGDNPRDKRSTTIYTEI